MLLNDIDAITQDSLNDISKVFYLKASEVSADRHETKDKATFIPPKHMISWYGFDPKSLHDYIMSTGDIREPHTRREITRDELTRLDACNNMSLKKGVWWFAVNGDGKRLRRQCIEDYGHDDTVLEFARIAYLEEAADICGKSLDAFSINIRNMMDTYEGCPQKTLQMLTAIWCCMSKCISKLFLDSRFVTSRNTTWHIVEQMKSMVIEQIIILRKNHTVGGRVYNIDKDIWIDAKNIITLSIIHPGSIWKGFTDITHCISHMCRNESTRRRLGKHIIKIAEESLSKYGILTISSDIEDDIKNILDITQDE